MKKRAIVFTAILLFAVGAVAYFIMPRFFETQEDTPWFTTGEAQAVAVTPVFSMNGLIDPLRIFDELYAPIGIALMGDYIVVADSMCDRVQIIGNDTSRRIGRHGRYGLSYYHAGAFIDGFLETAMFMKPSGVFATPCGGIIVTDTGNHAIRKIIGEFVITLAGNGTAGFRNGAEGQALFNAPRAAAANEAGYIFVADTLNHAIRRISPAGYVSLYAGAAGESGFADGTLYNARFFEPSGLYLTAEGVLYVADAANHAIRRIADGNVTTVAGQPGEAIRFSDYFHGGFTDGCNTLAMFNFPRDIARMPDGALLIADSLNHAIRLVTAQETRTLLGGGVAGFAHHSTENMRLTRPEGLATNGELLFISDTVNNRIVAVPLTERVLAGRPPRTQLLAETGLTINSRFAFRGDIRVFHGDTRIDMGRVAPWAQGDSIFIPIRPLLEALGADVHLNEDTGVLYIQIGETLTTLTRDRDYFILRGVMVTTLEEMLRLFPFTLEWFPELSLLVAYVPQDLRAAYV